MTGPAEVLVCDWGNTNLRAWTLDDQGRVVAAQAFAHGVLQLGPGEAERCFQTQIRPALQAQTLPALLCGAVGSTVGWSTAPYADCPASLEDLARALHAPTADGWVRIVPGVRWAGFSGQGDVMRGEETQLFGWLAADPSRALGRRIVCHPGTHGKWMVIEDGRLTKFASTMTGELYALLRQHSILSASVAADDVFDEAAFDEGVVAAGNGEALAARLFTVRARVVGFGRPLASTASYLSGLMIGAEVAATPTLLEVDAEEAFDLLGDPRLCRLYARALAARGRQSETHDGDPAAIAGLFAIFQKARNP
jgi:2-dehydro-3-deoxygalactonokinase